MHMQHTKGCFRRFVCLLLCLAMILSLGVTAFADTTEKPEILSVPEHLSASVANGASKDEAIAALPKSVTAQVQEAGPFASVEGKRYQFTENAKPDDWNVVVGDVTFTDGVVNFPKTKNVKAVTGDTSMTDYVVEVKLRGEGTVGADYGVMFRANDVTFWTSMPLR